MKLILKNDTDEIRGHSKASVLRSIESRNKKKVFADWDKSDLSRYQQIVKTMINDWEKTEKALKQIESALSTIPSDISFDYIKRIEKDTKEAYRIATLQGRILEDEIY